LFIGTAAGQHHAAADLLLLVGGPDRSTYDWIPARLPMALAALLLFWRLAISQDPSDRLPRAETEGHDQAWVQPAIPSRQSPLATRQNSDQDWAVAVPDGSGSNRIESWPSRITK
jgi:hypothetical protein